MDRRELCNNILVMISEKLLKTKNISTKSSKQRRRLKLDILTAVVGRKRSIIGRS